MRPIEQRFEREVRRIVVLSNPELELLARVAALQADGHQDQRRVPDVHRVLGIDPLQRAECEVEDVDPLLLFQRPGIEVEFEQPFLQSLRCQSGLQSGVRMPKADPAFIDGVIFGLRKIVDFVGLFFAFVFTGFRRSAREESEGTGFAYEEPKYLDAFLVHDLDGPRRFRGARHVEQPVPGGKVEEFRTRSVELFAKGQGTLENGRGLNGRFVSSYGRHLTPAHVRCDS